MKRYLCPRIRNYIFISCLIGFLSGCSQLNCSRFGDLLGKNTDLIGFSYHIADTLLNGAGQALVPGNPEMPIMVTTFVDNNDLEKTSPFGRTVQEYISSRLVQQGYAVKEIKLAKELLIKEKSGESILTRNLARLSQEENVQAIVVGTISSTKKTMYLSARMVNPTNRTILSATDYRLCMDATIRAMFAAPEEKQSHIEEAIREPARPWLNSILY